ncbi:hypothetical protein SAMN05421890_2383 [Ensifer adhaerens]|nr:hypothetical protein SAMN05421890_2383 [Ensifer adhaerens]
MGDILIRDVPENLKRDVQQSAQRAGRSLSDELKLLIRRGLAAEQLKPLDEAEGTYLRMRAAFSDAQLDDAEHSEFMRAIEASRSKGSEREPPDFS